MSIIYKPSGKAREYSPLAINLYTGCNHNCVYCYVPMILRQSSEQKMQPNVRRDVLRELEKDCKKNYASKEQVLFSFMTDPYNSLEIELKIMREALKMLYKYRIPVSILTKAGMHIFRDIDVIKKFGKHITIGTTLTFNNDKDSIEYEPNAALPAERLKMLSDFHELDIRTWASFEPVIIPDQSIDMMNKCINYVDFIKVGKINNWRQFDKSIDWSAFLEKSVNMLRDSKKPFYVKYDLRMAAQDIKLYGNEVLPDEFNTPCFNNEDTAEMDIDNG